jgi:hypothetical protein
MPIRRYVAVRRTSGSKWRSPRRPRAQKRRRRLGPVVQQSLCRGRSVLQIDFRGGRRHNVARDGLLLTQYTVGNLPRNRFGGNERAEFGRGGPPRSLRRTIPVPLPATSTLFGVVSPGRRSGVRGLHGRSEPEADTTRFIELTGLSIRANSIVPRSGVSDRAEAGRGVVLSRADGKAGGTWLDRIQAMSWI